jgi:hypothetical protein
VLSSLSVIATISLKKQAPLSSIFSDDAVALFVNKMTTNMTDRVALDDKTTDPDGFMATHWWKRKVEHHTIPHAVVIKNNRIASIGHPKDLTESVLDEILSGHFDFDKAAAAFAKEH